MSNETNLPTITKVAHTLIVLLAVGWILHIGSSIILPIIFAIILSIFLYPIEKKIRKLVKWKPLSIVLGFCTLIVPFLIIVTLFSFQFMSIMESLPSIGQDLESGFDKIIKQVESWIPALNVEKMMNKENPDLMKPIGFIGQGFVSTTSFLTSVGMTLIYAFFLLFYRKNIKTFILYQFAKKTRPEINQTLTEIKETIQSYIGGIGIVVIVLSVLNSIGLSIIGIKYAIFWGILGGLLAIIPYIGTLIGGLLPFLFALSTAEAYWQPIAVLVFYGFVQMLEGNLITPKIVGDKVDVNPLFAILAIVFFGTFWGVAGIVLALPIISILKIVLSNFEETESYAVLMSTEIGEKNASFKK